jgi:hypothetical protein
MTIMKKTGHAAIIGEPTNPDVTEDATTTGTLVASGTISISDPDPGRANRRSGRPCNLQPGILES